MDVDVALVLTSQRQLSKLLTSKKQQYLFLLITNMCGNNVSIPTLGNDILNVYLSTSLTH